MDTTEPITPNAVTLGVIGTGIMGRRLLAAAREQPAVRVSGVWDPAPGALAGLWGAEPGVPVLPSAEAVVAASECVYVASPPATHVFHARRALAAGRAVFCEKPLATDVADARLLLDEDGAAERAAVNFPFASAEPVARLREWLDAGAVGTPRAVSISVAFARWPRPWQHGAASWLDGRAEGGFVREVVSHFLFLAQRLFGTLAVETASVSFPENDRSERAVTARLRAGGIPVSLDGTVGRTEADDSNAFTVEGDAGSVRLLDWGTPQRLVAGRWLAEPAEPHGTGRMTTLARQLDGVAAMTRGEPHHLATLAEAFAVQETVETILRGVIPGRLSG